MNAWSQLPNAALIDWVLQSAKDNPELWVAALNDAWIAAWREAWNAGERADRGEAWDAALDVTMEKEQYTACGVLAALVAYDDCDMYLSMSYDELHAWALLSETPQAVLMLPLKWVQEHEQQSMVTPT